MTGVNGFVPADNTSFPLLQSAVTATATTLTADTAANSQGASLTVTHVDLATGNTALSISIPSLGVSNIALTDQGTSDIPSGHPDETYTASLSGGRTLQVDLRRLNYVAYGSWAISTAPTAAGLTNGAAAIGGLSTPGLTALTAAGATATYSGQALGVAAVPAGATWKEANLSGAATLSADFGKNSITGSLSGMTATPIDGGAAESWDTVSLTGTISGIGFSGATAVTTAPAAGVYALGATATGHVDGGFFGPTADEVGAVWTLYDGSKAAVGVLGGEATSATGGAGLFASGSGSNTSAGSGSVSVWTGGGGITIPPGGGIIAVNTPGNITVTGPGGVLIGMLDGSIKTNVTPPVAVVGGSAFTGLNQGPLAAGSVPPQDNSILPTILEAMEAQPTGGAASTLGIPASLLAFVHVDPVTGRAQLTIDLQSLGSGAVTLTDLGHGASAALELYSGTGGGKSLNLALAHLDYTAFGDWTYGPDSAGWVTGYRTPTGGLPTAGAASYSGQTFGVVTTHVGGASATANLAGDANMNVNFASGQLTGGLTNMTATAQDGTTQPWDSVAITATLSGSSFSGDTSVSNAPPSGTFTTSAGGKGKVDGAFYGLTGQELGAAWSLDDGPTHAVGALGATKH